MRLWGLIWLLALSAAHTMRLDMTGKGRLVATGAVARSAKDHAIGSTASGGARAGKGKARRARRARRRERKRERRGARRGGTTGTGTVISSDKVKFVKSDLTTSTLKGLKDACIVVSANTGLLSKKATGIAGKVVAVGGKALLKASKKETKKWGGTVPVGKAAWTSGGGFKGIAYAVTMSYKTKNGKKTRVKATPEAVRKAFAAALRVCGKHKCKVVATTILSARAGYSNQPENKAKEVMRKAMLKGVDDVKKDGVKLEKLKIYTG